MKILADTITDNYCNLKTDKSLSKFVYILFESLI